MTKAGMYVRSVLAIAAVCFAGTRAQGVTIAVAELTPSGTLITLDNHPVVSAILSTPFTTNGFTQSTPRWIFLVDDGTGSMDMFNAASSFPAGYTPTVGDALTISGTNSPFMGVPELGTLTSITKNSSGNPTPLPLIKTIPQLATYTTAPTPGSPYPSFAGHLVEIDNVTISSSTTGNYGSSNVFPTITDSSSNTIEALYGPNTYSIQNQNLFGTPISTGPVDVTGLVQIFGGAPEFLPFSVTPVPEPSTFALGALSLVGLVAWKKRLRMSHT